MRLAAQEKGNDVGASIPTSKRTPPAISWPQFRISYAMYKNKALLFLCEYLMRFLTPQRQKERIILSRRECLKIQTFRKKNCTSHRKYVRVRDAETGVSLLICKINLT